jgi:maltooligosyltrehalose trehalohydrolase
MRHRDELPFDAELTPSGVRFRLWAPRAAAVWLRLEGDDAAHLRKLREPDGWFALTTGSASPASRDRYEIEGKVFPDPVSRHQRDGVHGPSEVVDPAAYASRDLGWCGRAWEEIALYELHLGTFSKAGDCAGAVERLDHAGAAARRRRPGPAELFIQPARSGLQRDIPAAAGAVALT